MENLSDQDQSFDMLREALAKAREDALQSPVSALSLQSQKITRLNNLLSATKPVFEELTAGDFMFDLRLEEGSTPRLWFGVLNYIEVGEDGQYGLFRNEKSGPRFLKGFQTDEDASQGIFEHVTRLIVEREQNRYEAKKKTTSATQTAKAGSDKNETQPITEKAKNTALKRDTRRLIPHTAYFWAGVAIGILSFALFTSHILPQLQKLQSEQAQEAQLQADPLKQAQPSSMNDKAASPPASGSDVKSFTLE